MSSYTIVTCDWEPNQTKMWLHYVEKNCPTAQVITVPDTKPVPHCWSGGKLNCFCSETVDKMDHPDRVIYMDTDTVVLKDPEPVFDMMGDCFVGSSLGIIPNSLINRVTNSFKGKGFYIGSPYVHYPSGFLSFLGMPMGFIYSPWLEYLKNPTIRGILRGNIVYEEVCLSMVMKDLGLTQKTYDIPLSFHGNLLGKKEFGGAELPWIVHYHNLARLRKFGMGHYQIGEDQRVSKKGP